MDWIVVAQNRSECSADVNTKQYAGFMKVGGCVSDWSVWHIARTLTVSISCDSLQWLASSQGRTEGGVWGVQTPSEIPKFCQS
jgi:hypothetical protein